MEKFWSIFVANMPNNLNERFTDYNDAVKEAYRRSELFPDNTFIVMEICGYAQGTSHVDTEYIGDVEESITVPSKNTIKINISFTDRQGDALDLTGCSVQFIILPKPDSMDDDAMYNETKINTSLETDPYPENGFSGNEATFYIPEDVTLVSGLYYYQIRFYSQTGDKEIYANSNFIVE